MLIRALIVLLVVLNLGVAAWWMGRPDPTPGPLPQQPSGIPTLELVAAGAGQDSRPVSAAAMIPSMPTAATVSAAVSCASLGPYAEQALAAAARQRLLTQQQTASLRELPAAGARSYRVLIPSSDTREQAQAIGKRIGEAGFKDFLVIGAGGEINSIALGVYGSRDAALQRQATLQAAGFAAQVRAAGAKSPSQWWLDMTAATPESLAQAQRVASAVQSQALDCALLR